MFEQPIEKQEEGNKNRVAIFAAVILVLAAATGTLLYSAFSSHQKSPPQPGLSGAQRVGSPDFDSYRKDVAISNQEFYYSTNALGGRQIVARGRVQNFGGRTIKGLEVRAVAYGFDGKPLGERVAAPIPRATPEPLQPNGSLPISVVIDSAPEEYMVQEIKLELHGLILQ
jgi:hypothetical protein